MHLGFCAFVLGTWGPPLVLFRSYFTSLLVGVCPGVSRYLVVSRVQVYYVRASLYRGFYLFSFSVWWRFSGFYVILSHVEVCAFRGASNPGEVFVGLGSFDSNFSGCRYSRRSVSCQRYFVPVFDFFAGACFVRFFFLVFSLHFLRSIIVVAVGGEGARGFLFYRLSDLGGCK